MSISNALIGDLMSDHGVLLQPPTWGRTIRKCPCQWRSARRA